MKNTVLTLMEKKTKGEKISMVTCYDYTSATLVERAGIDMVLVGDSLGMTMLGMPDTLSVTMEDMIHHSLAVSKGLNDAFLVTDMPFMSYHTTVEDAVRNAGRLLKEGRSQAVKIEGGVDITEEIKAITAAGIPVCGHIGMTPQSVNAFGGFKAQGRDLAGAERVIKDAIAVEESGAFCVVLECVPSLLAQFITELLSIPTIGIGAGSDCDGQVLVYQDLLGMNMDFKPKFVKTYGEVGAKIVDALQEYAKEVKETSFPGPEHGFKIEPEIIDELRSKIKR